MLSKRSIANQVVTYAWHDRLTGTIPRLASSARYAGNLQQLDMENISGRVECFGSAHSSAQYSAKTKERRFLNRRDVDGFPPGGSQEVMYVFILHYNVT